MNNDLTEVVIGQSYSSYTFDFIKNLDPNKQVIIILYNRSLKNRVISFARLKRNLGIFQALKLYLEIFLETPIRIIKSVYISKFLRMRKFTFYKCRQENQLIEILSTLNTRFIILAHSLLLSKSVISIAQAPIYNVHPGLIPKYRGVDVVYWSLFNYENPVLTLYEVSHRIDNGEILYEETVPIENFNTIEECLAYISRRSIEILGNIDRFITTNRISSHKNEVVNNLYHRMDSEKRKLVEKNFLKFRDKIINEM